MQLEYLDHASMIMVLGTLREYLFHRDGLSCKRVVAYSEYMILNRAKDDRQRDEALLQTLLLMLNDDLLFRKNLLRLGPSLHHLCPFGIHVILTWCRCILRIQSSVSVACYMAEVLHIIENILTFLQQLINIIFHNLVLVQLLNLFIIWFWLQMLRQVVDVSQSSNFLLVDNFFENFFLLISDFLELSLHEPICKF